MSWECESERMTPASPSMERLEWQSWLLLTVSADSGAKHGGSRNQLASLTDSLTPLPLLRWGFQARFHSLLCRAPPTQNFTGRV